MKTLFLIPFYNHPEKIKALCEALARYNLPILIVDDGSDEASKKALQNLSEFGVRKSFVSNTQIWWELL